MQWDPFEFDGKSYDLSHLHPCVHSYVQPAKGTNLPRCYKAEILFSLHCFTRGGEGETVDAGMQYSDHRENRVLDFRRYNLSLQLPAIVKSLMTRKCFHTERGNVFTVSIVDEGGDKVDYEIYFTVSKSSKAGIINLFIQSAYPRDAAYSSSRPRKHPKPIGFPVIVYNVLNRIPIKAPK